MIYEQKQALKFGWLVDDMTIWLMLAHLCAQNRDERASSPCAPQSTAAHISNNNIMRNWPTSRRWHWRWWYLSFAALEAVARKQRPSGSIWFRNARCSSSAFRQAYIAGTPACRKWPWDGIWLARLPLRISKLRIQVRDTSGACRTCCSTSCGCVI